MNDEEYLYAIALRASPFVGDVNFMKLIGAAGSAKDTWKLSQKLLQKIPGIGDKISRSIGDESLLKFAEKELEFCRKNNIQIKLRHQNELPKLLSECNDAPAILYQKGFYDESLIPVSIVGTRNITAYGRTFVEELLAAFKGRSLLIVSGLALGTDGCAHAEAIKNGISTVGVLAHGLHTFYPSQHKKLAQEMITNGGALLTEFNSSEKPDREHFLQRNRIVAGLSPVTIVVETAFGGGSISTVSFANDYNREVYALPGKITDKYSQGCNLIISQNKARIINDIKDIMNELGMRTLKPKTGNLFENKTVKLNNEFQSIYDCIAKYGQISLDDLSENLSIAPYKLLPILLDLELKTHIKALPGKQYCIK